MHRKQPTVLVASGRVEETFQRSGQGLGVVAVEYQRKVLVRDAGAIEQRLKRFWWDAHVGGPRALTSLIAAFGTTTN